MTRSERDHGAAADSEARRTRTDRELAAGHLRPPLFESRADGVTVRPFGGTRQAAAILVLGLILTSATFVLSSRAYEAAAQSRQDREVDALLTSIDNAFSNSSSDLHGLRTLFEAVTPVEPDAFQRFAEDMLARHPEIRGLSWNPRLPPSDADGRRQHLAQLGLAELEPWQGGPDGRREPADYDRGVVVVGLIAPLATNSSALGFDISSERGRRVALETSLATGRVTQTSPVHLVQQADPDASGILTVLPVMAPDPTRPGAATSVSAWVVQVSEPQVVIDRQGHSLWSRRGWAFTLWDPTDDGHELLAFWGSPTPLPAHAKGTLLRQLTIAHRPIEAVLRPLHPPPLNHEPWGMSGSVLFFAALISFVVWRLDQQRRLAEQLARTDSLTGLSNRRDFYTALERVLARGLDVTLVLVDVDHFKHINDTFGHAVGDHVLQLIADTLHGMVRINTDRVGRIGGEEFALLITDAGPEEIPALWARLRAQIEALAEVLPAPVTISAGFASPSLEPPDALVRSNLISPVDRADLLFRAADAGLYRAKSLGRDRAVIHRSGHLDEVE